MKEFSAQTGGRYTYIDDVMNLQDLALSFAALFDGCDNFIISGCEVSGKTISSGYVYINGKIRRFSGASDLTWPQYIYESNRTESVAYENGTDKIGRSIYGCEIGSVVPSSLDLLTNAVPQFIHIPNTGGVRMKDALFGKYSLLLNPESGTQDANGIVNFKNNINISKALTVNGRSIIQTGNAVGQMYYDSGKFIIQSRIGTGKIYKIELSDDYGFAFHVDNDVFFSVNDTFDSKKPIVSDSVNGGNTRLSGSNVFNSGVSSDSGSIYINSIGYNGGVSYFRNTYIGNGKNASIISVNGKEASTTINGTLDLQSPIGNGLVLTAGQQRTNDALQKTIVWRDSEKYPIGYVGYSSTSNKSFEINNSLGEIKIFGSSYVDLGPYIMENGVRLSNKYALANDVNLSISQCAQNIVSLSDSIVNAKYSTITGGLSQFVSTTFTKQVLRDQIEAVSISDVSKGFPTLDNKLSDMAKTEQDKKDICSNIGATYGGDYQKKLNDSGWINFSGELYVRQIGNMVSINGYITTTHSGTIFTIPNNIDAPTHVVTFSTVTNSYTGLWRCSIAGGSKACTVEYCNNHGVRIPISITYMV